MESRRARLTVAAGLLAAFVGLAAMTAHAQTPAGQGGKPQPAPAPKVAPPKSAAPASGPQGAAPKPAGAGEAAQKPPAKPAATGGATQKPPGAKPAPARKKLPPRTSPRWKGRGFASVSGGALVAAPGHRASVTFRVHAEDATLDASSTVRVGPAFGARAGLRVWKNLALGADVALSSATQRLSVSGSLPHPFQFNAFRKVSGAASGLERLETMAAAEASWLVALGRRVDMFVFGGPASFGVRQDMATAITFTEFYPYDTATFTGVTSGAVRGNAVGFTSGVEVSYLVTKSFGVGGLLRFSHASATLRPQGKRTTVPLGGLQVGLSARVLF